MESWCQYIYCLYLEERNINEREPFTGCLIPSKKGPIIMPVVGVEVKGRDQEELA